MTDHPKIWCSILLAFLCLHSLAQGQPVSSFLPEKLHKSENYLFYLHGGVVTVLGDNAINPSMPEWGRYEYSNILDSLKRRGFNIISEIRKQEVHDSVYVDKIFRQIDTLIRAGIHPRNIMVVGASAGSAITIHVSAKMKKKDLKFAILGGCWPDTYKEYENLTLYGHFLSIIESSDPHGTCIRIFEGRKELNSWKEVKLNMGNSHGFIYKGYKEWIDPLVQWFKELK